MANLKVTESYENIGNQGLIKEYISITLANGVADIHRSSSGATHGVGNYVLEEIENIKYVFCQPYSTEGSTTFDAGAILYVEKAAEAQELTSVTVTAGGSAELRVWCQVLGT